MNDKTSNTLKRIRKQTIIQRILKTTCYIAIISAIMIYASIGITKTQTIKLVNKFKDDKEDFVTEKIMTNPEIKVKYGNNDIYDIKAKEAFHKDESEAILKDVVAISSLGKIESGKLKIEEEGDRLIFTDKPILILNKKE